jgi:hypothetical protein
MKTKTFCMVVGLLIHGLSGAVDSLAEPMHSSGHAIAHTTAHIAPPVAHHSPCHVGNRAGYPVPLRCAAPLNRVGCAPYRPACITAPYGPARVAHPIVPLRVTPHGVWYRPFVHLPHVIVFRLNIL